MRKVILGLAVIFTACFVQAQTYTQTEFQNSMRLTLEPGHLAAQLSTNDAPIVTATLADTWKKVEGATNLTVNAIQDFTYDVGNDYFVYSGSGVNADFKLTASMSFNHDSAQTALVTVSAYKNGSRIDGVFSERTITGGSSATGVIILSGHFILNVGDFVEIWVMSDKAGDFSVKAFATDIIEENQ